ASAEDAWSTRPRPAPSVPAASTRRAAPARTASTACRPRRSDPRRRFVGWAKAHANTVRSFTTIECARRAHRDRAHWQRWWAQRANARLCPPYGIRAWRTSGRELHVFEVARLIVDADARRRDPAGELAGLDHLRHQALDEIAVAGRGQPLVPILRPGGGIDELARGRRVQVLELADVAMKRHVRHLELESHPRA